MNYNSVEDILTAGLTNMTAVRTSSNDDGVDAVAGASWFTFNGNVANTVYISGNTFFGFGQNAEHLKVNRRDAKVYYIYREEGTLYNYYHFVKFRWSGYSQYSSTSSDRTLQYDVIIWETGDISLHMIAIPTAYNDGVYSLTESANTYTYTVTTDNPNVAFYKAAGNTRRVASELINITQPFDKKYLIRANEELYDVLGQPLETNVLTAATFRSYGGDNPPTSAVLTSFDNPDVLLWYDSTDYLPHLIATETATPPPQMVYSYEYDMTDATILGIESADVVAADTVLFGVSVDGGESYKAYNGESWGTLTTLNSGMSASQFVGIGVDEWAEIAGSATESIKIRALLTDTDTDYITRVIINFLNP